MWEELRTRIIPSSCHINTVCVTFEHARHSMYALSPTHHPTHDTTHHPTHDTHHSAAQHTPRDSKRQCCYFQLWSIKATSVFSGTFHFASTCLYIHKCIPSSCVQWNLSIVDTAGTQLAVLYTMEPLYRGHHSDPAGCPQIQR